MAPPWPVRITPPTKPPPTPTRYTRVITPRPPPVLPRLLVARLSALFYWINCCILADQAPQTGYHFVHEGEKVAVAGFVHRGRAASNRDRRSRKRSPAEPAKLTSMEDDEDDFDHDEGRRVPGPDEIDWSALRSALTSLQLFDDPYMAMQATNLGIVDQFLTGLEFQVLQESFQDDRDISGMMFLNAQSQMWMFSAYELLRTWRQRIRETLDLLNTGELHVRIDELLKDQGFRHYGMEIRAKQLRRVLKSPDSRRLMEEDLRIAHVLYKQLDYLRVAHI